MTTSASSPSFSSPPSTSASSAGSQAVQWYSTTRTAPWQRQAGVDAIRPFTGWSSMDVMLLEDQPRQTMEGFGATFNELGWQALISAPALAREVLLRSLFEPGQGLNLRLCRVPIGASDFAFDWYSHAETADDWEMAHFDIARDERALIPFIRAAQQFQPELQLWASPWSPPTWMKHNRHYAMQPSPPSMPDNGMRPEQAGRAGEDMFILDDAHLRAYALYFRKFVEAYRDRGIPVTMVMPQNEFNSAQFFPACCWTPEGLARFVPYLSEQMGPLGVSVFLGTLERAEPALIDAFMANDAAARCIEGIGVQWAARRAAPAIHARYPQLKLYQTEQECGDGSNDWRMARYAWTMMREFILAGASAYTCWNIALPQPGVSTWGWKQNALISIDTVSGAHQINLDAYVLMHLSHHVQPGAQRLDTVSVTGHDNLLAFRNPNGELVVACQNDLSEPLALRIAARGQVLHLQLPADSLNTLVF